MRTRVCVIGTVVVLIAAVAMARNAAAQETVNYASISGRVADTSGAVIPGAQISVRNTETNVKATAATDQDGRFRFPYLRVGPYEVAVTPGEIEIGGHSFPVQVERDIGLGRRPSAAAGVGQAQLKAPMPGLLVKILCQVGDTVEAGQPMAVLQAMKMENELSLPRGGTVKLPLAAFRIDSLSW